VTLIRIENRRNPHLPSFGETDFDSARESSLHPIDTIAGPLRESLKLGSTRGGFGN